MIRGEAVGIGPFGRVPARDGHVREEHAEHRSCAHDLDSGTERRETLLEPRSGALQPIPDARLGDRAQGLDPRGHREWVPRQRPRLVHGAGRSDELHDLAAPTVRPHREAASDHLAERRQVGRDAVERLRSARMHAEPGHHLVEDEQGAVLVGDLAQPLEKTRLGKDEAHVPGDRLDDHRRDVVVPGEERLDRLEVVVRRGERVGDSAGRDPWRVGKPERRDTRSRPHEEQIRVAVVAPDELDDLRPPRERPRDAQRAHRGLGPGADEPDELEARHRLLNEARELELERAGRAEARPLAQRLLERTDDSRMRMAENERPPGEDVVEVAVAVDVDEVRAFAALDEERRAAHGSKRADGRADAAWHQARRLREEPLGPRAIHTPAPASARTTDSAAVSPDRMQSGMPTPRYAAPATARPGCLPRAPSIRSSRSRCPRTYCGIPSGQR